MPMRTQQLDSLVQRLGTAVRRPLRKDDEGRPVTALTSDSRRVESGSLFIALRGERVDGHRFLPEVAERGAAAALCCADAVDDRLRALLAERGVAVVEVADTAACCADTAAWFYRDPAAALRLVGITGTNGKTTVTSLTEQLLLAAGTAAGVLGTVNNRYTVEGKTHTFPAALTTPEPIELHRMLRTMVDAGVEVVVMEVSSHGLSRRRVEGLEYEVAAFTNLSRDHLDYHNSMEDYFAAKSLLFSRYLKEGGTAVIPAQGRWGEQLDRILAAGGLQTVSRHGGSGAEFALEQYRLHLDHSEFRCRIHRRQFQLTTPLVGSYNLENLLTAWGVAAALGVTDATIAAAVPRLRGAPGRVERVSVDEYWPAQGPVVLVDYAHTPDALEKVLGAVAGLPHRTLCAVFGCGGDRDGGKRPLMGEVAARLADVAIVTDDNPRSEDSAAIVNDILAGMPAAVSPRRESDWLDRRGDGERGTVVIADRGHAIDRAVRSFGAGDVVVIAGKGHEACQTTPQGKFWFDDRRRAEDALLCWTAPLVAEATGGRLVGVADDSRVRSLGAVTTDSRAANPSGIFVALKGARHDGHDFAAEAVAQGNCCLVVERDLRCEASAAPLFQVVVADTTRALGDLAAFRRRAIGRLLAATGREQQVIGLTGSCGKTTVKEMIASILRRRWPAGELFPESTVLKTAGNFNNLIGLPLSLLPLGVTARAVILEMGMNAPGEIDRLAEIADPDISLITNVADAHLEGLGSREGVAAAKAELFARTRTDGVLVVNLDDPHIVARAAGYPHTRLTFSADPAQKADVRAREIECGERGCCAFLLERGAERCPVQLTVPGEHNVSNALAAAAVCSAAGVGLDEIAAGLADFSAVDKRLQLAITPQGFTLINDCYNANPGSMAAALRVLASFSGTRVAIIGDMLELGAAAEAAHEEIGRLAATLAVDRLAVIGTFAAAVERGALAAGFEQRRLQLWDSREQALQGLAGLVEGLDSEQDAVLVKASRGLALEHLTTKLSGAQP